MKAKKDKELTPPCLTAAQYWEWRCTINDMDFAKNNKANLVSSSQILSQQIQIMTLELRLLRSTKLVEADSKIAGATAEYERLKKVLETELGVSLSGKMIDDCNFEVKDLPKQ